MEVAGGDAGGAAGHADGVVGGDLDADAAAGHVDGEVGLDEAEAVGDGGGGAGAAAGGEGVAGAAFPDLDADVGAIEDLEELHVGAAGEDRVCFEVRAVAVGELGGDGVERGARSGDCRWWRRRR